MDQTQDQIERAEATQAWVRHQITRDFRKELERRRDDAIDRALNARDDKDTERAKGVAVELKEIIAFLTPDGDAGDDPTPPAQEEELVDPATRWGR